MNVVVKGVQPDSIVSPIVES